MAFKLSDISVSRRDKPPIITIYGPPGIGKTSFAAQAPNPVFIQCEEGEGILPINSFPVIKTFDQIIEAFGVLVQEDHGFRTAVVDTTSSLEPLIWNHACRVNNKSSIEDFGYGKGYIEAMEYWNMLVSATKILRDKGMIVILLAHSDIIRLDPPDNEPYDRYQIKLHKRAFQLLYEQSDIIGFANNKPYIKKVKEGQKESRQAIQMEGRMLNLVEKPAFIAKNRYDLPEQIPFPKEGSWDELAKAMHETAPQINLSGD